MQPETYEPLPSMPEEPPDADLLGSEACGWDAVPNLDQFFTRIYRYWEAKGFAVMLLSRLLNLAALGFTVLTSALLLLYVNWGALQAECLRKDTCDIMEVAFRRHPLEGGLTPGRLVAVLYLAAFSAYWLVALAHLVLEVRDLVEVRHFCQQRLGVSERQMATITWPEVAHRLVQVQATTRLCIVRDLSEHDVVSRIMRKENYLIAMLNRGVLALHLPLPGLRRHFLLTKTLEWNLYWCVLDALFDDHFRIKRTFLYDERALRRRFRVMAALNLAASPFMLLFLLIYFFMKNAEKFYHHPSSLGARRWSPLAKWRLREFNELPHFITHRLNASHAAAERYIQQFPNHMVSHVARFVAFVSGSFAALLLALALIDERLLERDLMGRQIVWWVATVGMVLALSRAFIIESGAAFDPEAALMEVVAHTHYLPRHWRGRAHTREVQEQFERLFQFKALLFLEELASTLLTPFVLYFSLPKCAGAILRFVEENTTHIEGVGDVCSLAAWDFGRHGNAKYGAPAEAPKAARSRQGKMEKSFLSFAAAYPQWEPPEGPSRAFLGAVAAQPLHPRAAAAAAALALQQAGGGAAGLAGAGSLLAAAGGFGGGALGAPQLQPGLSLFASQLHGALPLAGAQHGQGGWLGRLGSPPQHKESGIFASAELADAAGAAWAQGRAHRAGAAPHAALGLGPLGSGSVAGGGFAPADAGDRVAVSQMLLQSIYEEREDAATAVSGGLDLGPSSPRLPPPQQQQQPQQPPLFHSHPHANPGHSPLQPASVPRQTWTRPPAPSRSRQLSSELSVLSREPSGLSRERSADGSMPAHSPAPRGSAAWLAQPPGGGSGAGPLLHHHPNSAGSPLHAYLGGPEAGPDSEGEERSPEEEEEGGELGRSGYYDGEEEGGSGSEQGLLGLGSHLHPLGGGAALYSDDPAASHHHYYSGEHAPELMQPLPPQPQQQQQPWGGSVHQRHSWHASPSQPSGSGHSAGGSSEGQGWGLGSGGGQGSPRLPGYFE